jgi:signal transduction histidine kinase
VEAMSTVADGPREMLIRSARAGLDVLVTVQDSGPGLPAEDPERIFESFYTTKPNGLGMGLSISRSIIEAHGGRLWASANAPRGAVFQFAVSADAGSAS